MSDSHVTLAQEQLAWAIRKFGNIATDPKERAMRFVEEALELGQAFGLDSAIAHKIATRVYSNEPGFAPKEAGQCQMTLSTLCQNSFIDLNAEYLREWDRIQSIPDDEWQRRHLKKVQLGIANLSSDRPQKDHDN